MAEPADACARALLWHCRSARLLPPLCAAAAGDRSARLRQCATEYLLLVRFYPGLLNKCAQGLAMLTLC